MSLLPKRTARRDLTLLESRLNGQPRLRLLHRRAIFEPRGAPVTVRLVNLVKRLKKRTENELLIDRRGVGATSVAVTRSVPVGGRDAHVGGPVSLQALPTWIA